MKSIDATESNVEKIAALFPQCVTERLNKEGKPELAIDFDKLRAELSTEVIDNGEERYQFTWPDKRAASHLANEATDKTLRPDIDASVDFWNTENQTDETFPVWLKLTVVIIIGIVAAILLYKYLLLILAAIGVIGYVFGLLFGKGRLN